MIRYLLGAAALAALLATPAYAQHGEEKEGLLKVCKVVVFDDVNLGAPFKFTANGINFLVPAGPMPGGYCTVVGAFAIGSNVALIELPLGYDVVGIGVVLAPPPGQMVVPPNNAAGTVTVKIGPGVTEVTYNNKIKVKQTGYLEICKFADGVSGPFTFTVAGAPAPVTIPAGTCSPPFQVPAGQTVIKEASVAGAIMTLCGTWPAGRQLGPPCPNTLTSIVQVVPGGISTQTVAVIFNGREKHGPASRGIPKEAMPSWLKESQ